MGTQMPGLDSAAAAKVLGVPPQAVKVNTQMAGGGFGRRAIPTSDYVVEACQVAKAARAAGVDAPVRTLVEPRGRHQGRLLPARCTCTARRSASTRRATSWPGTT